MKKKKKWVKPMLTVLVRPKDRAEQALKLQCGKYSCYNGQM